MPITAITIENFKGIGAPVRIELKPITLLFGPNSAGKSTIIQALHFAREVLEHGNVNPNNTLDGGFENIVHKHDKSLPIKIGIDYVVPSKIYAITETIWSFSIPYDWGLFSLSIDELYASELYQNVSGIYHFFVEFSVCWSEGLSGPFVSSYKVGINGEHFAEIKKNNDDPGFYLTDINLFNPIFGKDPRPRHSSDAYNSEEKRTEFFIRYFRRFFGGSKIPDDLLDVYDSIDSSAIPRFNSILCDMSSDVMEELWPGFEEGWWKKHDDVERLEMESDAIKMSHLFTTLMVTPRRKIRDELRRMDYIGPLREIPDRDHRSGRTSDNISWANGLAAWDILHDSNPAFVDKLNGWLSSKDRLNTGYRVVVKQYRELEESLASELNEWGSLSNEEIETIMEKVQMLPTKTHVFLREEGRDIDLSPQDVGVGISQVLPILVAALRGAFFAIEQPELHLHPALQVVLGDLFIVAIEDLKRDIDVDVPPIFQGKLPYRTHRFILETHSEHLLLRLLRRIRETSEGTVPKEFALTPSDISINFIEKEPQGTTISAIRVDKDGEFIDRWPRGFFDERVEELY